MRADWFQGSEFLLEIYCRSVALERFLTEQIKATDPKTASKRFKDLVRLQRAEAMLVANLATKLRLTPRSTFDRHTPKLVSILPKPWEIGGGQPGKEPEPRGFEREMEELERAGKAKKPGEPEGSPPPAA